MNEMRYLENVIPGLTEEESATFCVAIGAYSMYMGDSAPIGKCLRCGSSCYELYHIDHFPYAICNECKRSKG